MTTPPDWIFDICQWIPSHLHPFCWASLGLCQPGCYSCKCNMCMGIVANFWLFTQWASMCVSMEWQHTRSAASGRQCISCWKLQPCCCLYSLRSVCMILAIALHWRTAHHNRLHIALPWSSSLWPQHLTWQGVSLWVYWQSHWNDDMDWVWFPT